MMAIYTSIPHCILFVMFSIGLSPRSNGSDCGYSSSMEGSETSSREGSDVACTEGICNHDEAGQSCCLWSITGFSSVYLAGSHWKRRKGLKSDASCYQVGDYTFSTWVIALMWCGCGSKLIIFNASNPYLLFPSGGWVKGGFWILSLISVKN